MVCLSCRGPGPGLCAGCRQSLQPVSELRTPGGVTVRPWAAHEGAARTLVRRLKYEGVVGVADLVAAELALRVPDGARSLVPVVRPLVRRVRYGVDPATELALALSRRVGLPVVRALRAPVAGRANAGSNRRERQAPRFGWLREVDAPVLIDDVVTTGATLDRAAVTLGGCVVALTVTGVP